jgi:predicted porin
MKRTLIIAALTTLAAGATWAQSSVTIYGRLNLSAENQKNVAVAGQTVRVLQNSASRLGFKGTEDLGGGLKANFILEHGFNPDTGTAAASFWGRQSELNLSGGFGTFRLGNFTSEAYFATADYISNHNHDTGTSEDKLYAYLGRNGNKIAYRSPDLGGFTAEAAVSAAESTGKFRTYDLALNYGAGDLHVGLGYEKADTAKQIALSGAYTFGPVTLGAYVQRDTDGYGKGLGNRTNTRVSAMYALGNNEFHANVGRAGAYSKLKNSAASQLTLGYNYNLSKRTKLYSFFSKVNNGDNLSYFGATDKSGKAADTTIFAVGVRHNF